MVEEAEASFLVGMRLKGQGASNTHLVRSMAEMRRGAGRHAAAIRLLDKALDNAPRETLTDIYFLRGAPSRRAASSAALLSLLPLAGLSLRWGTPVLLLGLSAECMASPERL